LQFGPLASSERGDRSEACPLTQTENKLSDDLKGRLTEQYLFDKRIECEECVFFLLNKEDPFMHRCLKRDDASASFLSKLS
jgi:hypothetical protein